MRKTSPDERRAAIAATRFGLGARPGEIAEVGRDPLGWLLAQTEPAASPLIPERPDSTQIQGDLAWAERVQGDAEGRRLRAAEAEAETLARIRHAAGTPAGFRERWAMLWANHFAVPPEDFRSEALTGAFVREVVDRHAFDRFEDMAAAAARHPAMLIGFDQKSASGPNSPWAGEHGGGLNENLARETLELHTLGVGGGYGQGDVVALARAFTGCTVDDQGYRFDPSRHEPGARRLLGRTFPEGEDQAEAMVRAAARRPETHAHLARKVAKHFVADRPSPALVQRLQTALDRSDGSLLALAHALVTDPDAWTPEQAKLKRPYEHLVSTLRAAAVTPEDGPGLNGWLHAAAHHPLQPRSPAGASDDGAVWSTPLAVAQRAQLALNYGHRAPHDLSREFAEDVLGPLLTARTRNALMSGATRQEAFALVLMSPEFQRR